MAYAIPCCLQGINCLRTVYWSPPSTSATSAANHFIQVLGWSHFLLSQRARPHNWGLVLSCWLILEYRAHSYSTPGTVGAGKQLSVQVSIEDRATTLVITISSALPDIRDAGLGSISETLTATRPAETEADFYSRGVSLQSHCISSRITSHVQNDDS